MDSKLNKMSIKDKLLLTMVCIYFIGFIFMLLAIYNTSFTNFLRQHPPIWKCHVVVMIILWIPSWISFNYLFEKFIR